MNLLTQIKITSISQCQSLPDWFLNKNISEKIQHDFNDYCYQRFQMDPFHQTIKTIGHWSQIIGGFVGLILYILMLLTFRSPIFEGASYIYHKSMIYMELVHMVVMCQGGSVGYILYYFHLYDIIGGWRSYVIYDNLLNYLWVFGDLVKFSSTLVTLFVSFERTIAIWAPVSFNKINQYRIVYSLVAVSLLIGCLHLYLIFTGAAVQNSANPNIYYFQLNWFGQSQIPDISQQIINALKIGSCIIIFICCVLVAVGLVKNQKKAATMTTLAKEKWTNTKKLCVMQLVVAASVLIDHVLYVVQRAFIYQKELYANADVFKQISIERFDYDLAIREINFNNLIDYTWVVQVIMGILDHCGRFIFYLIGMKIVREAFFSLMPKKNQIIPLPPPNGANRLG